jgi:acetyltransferase-like isoleucine patch superfamily enzyme
MTPPQLCGSCLAKVGTACGCSRLSIAITERTSNSAKRVFFNFNCIVLDVCSVRTGDFTLFGPGVQISTPLHPFNAE